MRHDARGEDIGKAGDMTEASDHGAKALKIALRCVTEEPGARDIAHWVAQALREAEARGMEQAAGIVESRILHSDYVYDDGTLDRCAAAIRAAKEGI